MGIASLASRRPVRIAGHGSGASTVQASSRAAHDRQLLRSAPQSLKSLLTRPDRSRRRETRAWPGVQHQLEALAGAGLASGSAEPEVDQRARADAWKDGGGAVAFSRYTVTGHGKCIALVGSSAGWNDVRMSATTLAGSW